ncbi:tRNA wybutosine-synthesizing 2 [Hyphodiscus hymeniophilus]|uniref:tRNA wybutosine-synthesizing protein 2 n=1 Tax=Hyphodiscus hymeniophilus TaxID=353542 RepID=A0A9P6VDW7_9HELO|nr:tRNA wybutosine-synthesizing 2 [Hyphodiscus hymeniophilus]
MEETETIPRPSDLELPIKPKRKRKAKDVNPVESAIRAWLATLPAELVESLGLSIERLLDAAPKRWVVYPPMVLLPSGSFGDDHNALTRGLEEEHRNGLWREVVARIGKKEGKGILTHLAANSGIPLNKRDGEETENFLRSPSGLVMLYGDFGPGLISREGRPSREDFERAFWVSTKQNGIIQVWAPRWTMFSRGNVKEKARLLEFHSSQDLRSRKVGKEELVKQVVADMYAGIGYFVFSYMGMGIGRVLGWELNSWSVEGLRRGALANGWSIKVVTVGEEWVDSGERIVIFEEDNKEALARLIHGRPDTLGTVSHVNGGLLPTSEASWKMSLDILGGNGWLHLHENVGVNDVELRRVEIEGMFREWLRGKGDAREVTIEHVEFVKTFAPNVWHCVFDVHISSP